MLTALIAAIVIATAPGATARVYEDGSYYVSTPTTPHIVYGCLPGGLCND